jgi:hypothetical protein
MIYDGIENLETWYVGVKVTNVNPFGLFRVDG